MNEYFLEFIEIVWRPNFGYNLMGFIWQAIRSLKAQEIILLYLYYIF